MQKSLVRKVLVFGIIVLLVGAIVTPSITGYDKDVEKNDYLLNENETLNMKKVPFFSEANENLENTFVYKGEEEISYYDPYTLNNIIGVTPPNYWASAIRLTQDELGAYAGWNMTQVIVALSCDSGQTEVYANLTIYGEGTPTSPGSIIYEETGLYFDATQFYTIDLTDAIALDDHNEIWIAMWWNQTEEPAYIPYADDGPAVDEKGDWVNLGGSGWNELQSYGLDYNWAMGGIVEGLLADLTCDGILNWGEIEPGSTVTGNFTIENIGEIGSLLDWEIDSYPSWGSWTFEPENGTGLPVGSQQIVDVELIAPFEPNQYYTGTVKIINSINPLDFCTIDVSLTTLPKTPDLDCSGILSWSDVTPGETVTGTITVENIGESLSLLDWEITEYPEWGTWTFIPDSGVDLTPEDGPETIGVSVVAPDEENQDFSGHITLVNIEDGSDFCIIDVALATPANQPMQQSLFQKLFERFPNAFPILRNLYGLSL